MKKILITLGLSILVSCGGSPHLVADGASNVTPINPGQEPNPTHNPTTTITSTPTPNPTSAPHLSMDIFDGVNVVDCYDFGKIARNQKPEKVLKIKNLGNVPAHLVSIKNLKPHYFKVVDSNHCLEFILPGTSCEFAVSFKASCIGYKKDQIIFSYINWESKLQKELPLAVEGRKTRVHHLRWF